MKYLIFFLLFVSCKEDVVRTKTHPRHFKIEFKFYGPEIILPSYWGKEKNRYNLLFDNHSPTWLNDDIINQLSIKRVKNTYYSTSAADGSKIEGGVYKCDSVSLGGVLFNDVLLYRINDTASKLNGVIGENIISLGVWMIDFYQNTVTFASSADSMGKFIYFSKVLPSSFNDNVFIIEAEFRNGVKKKFDVDLGFNGEAILPLKDFNEINGSKEAYRNTVNFTTPGGKQILKNYTSHQKVLLGKDSVSFVYSSNEKIAENLVGLGFFRQFEIVILDYPNKMIYVSGR